MAKQRNLGIITKLRAEELEDDFYHIKEQLGGVLIHFSLR